MKANFRLLTLLALTLCLLLAPQIAAEPVTVETEFQVVQDKIVYGMPFNVRFKINTHDREFAGYDFTFSSEGKKIDFSSASASLSNGNFESSGTFTGSKDSGKSYRVKASTKSVSDKSSSLATIFTLNNLKFTGVATGSSSKITLTMMRDSSLGIEGPIIDPGLNEPKELVFSAAASESSLIEPLLSSCGDGFVGYVDPSPATGDPSGKTWEKCDDGNMAGSAAPSYITDQDGCSSDCSILDMDYTCSGTGAWQRTSCSPLSPKQIMGGKFSALLQGNCYPEGHPAALYCDAGKGRTNTASNANKFTLSQKTYFMSQLATALLKFFTSDGVMES